MTATCHFKERRREILDPWGRPGKNTVCVWFTGIEGGGGTASLKVLVGAGSTQGQAPKKD